MNPARGFLLASRAVPTAQQFDVPVQVTEKRYPPMSGVGTTDQADPFQCSANEHGGLLPGQLLGAHRPAVRRGDAVTLHRRDASEPGGVTSGPADQVDPFQRSTMACGCELLPSWAKAPPTAQQFQAPVQVVPISRSLLGDGVLGLVTMDQP